MKKLPIQFYKRQDVLLIVKELIGKIIITNFDGLITSGRIVETEAYIGCYNKMTALCFQHNRFSIGSYSRVNHRNKHRTRRPVHNHLLQAVCGLPDIVRRYFMRTIKQFKIG